MRNAFAGWSSVGAMIAVGVLVAACGGSNSSSTSRTATPALTKAEFVAKANAICTKGNAQTQTATAAYVKKLGLGANAKPTNAQVAKVADAVLIPGAQAEIDAIKALGAPSGDQQTVNTILAAVQQAVDKVKRNPALVNTNPKLFAAANKLASAYGLTACAAGS
jgi:hypothetical protein